LRFAKLLLSDWTTGQKEEEEVEVEVVEEEEEEEEEVTAGTRATVITLRSRHLV
jgi:hypothetical protein